MKEQKKISNFKFNFATMVATYLGIGNIKYAPGTFGSAATYPLFLIINFIIIKLRLNSIYQLITIYSFVLAALVAAAFWSINIYIGANKKKDPDEVVIDEVVGQMIAFIIPALLAVYYVTYVTRRLIFNFAFSLQMALILVIMPIILFRVFDILKPGLIGYYDSKVEGAAGIIMDDVVAGVYAGLAASLILSVFLLGTAFFI